MGYILEALSAPILNARRATAPWKRSKNRKTSHERGSIFRRRDSYGRKRKTSAWLATGFTSQNLDEI